MLGTRRPRTSPRNRRQIDAVQVLVHVLAVVEFVPVRRIGRIERRGERLRALRAVEDHVAVSRLRRFHEYVAAELLAEIRQHHRLPQRRVRAEKLQIVAAEDAGALACCADCSP